MTYKVIVEAHGWTDANRQHYTAYGIPTFVLSQQNGFGPTSAQEACELAGRILHTANPRMTYAISVGSEKGEYAVLTVKAVD